MPWSDNSMYKEIAEIIVYVLAGVGALSVMFRKVFNGVKGFEWHFKKAVDGQLSINLALEKNRLALNADRVDLLYSSNGGGIPYAGANIYVTLLAESISPEQISYIHKWEHQKADVGYLEVLSRMHTEDIYVIRDITEEPDSILRRGSSINDLNTIVFIKIASAKKKYYFAAIAFTDIAKVGDIELEKIRILRDELIQLIK